MRDESKSTLVGQHRFCGGICLAVGLGLLLVQLWGEWGADLRGDLRTLATSTLNSDGKRVLNYHTPPSRPLTRVPYLERIDDDELRRLNDELFLGVSHFFGGQRPYMWYENWILSGLALVRPSLGLTVDAKHVVCGGYGNCTQLSGVALESVKRAGGMARFVIAGDKHACAEVWIDGKEQRLILDPDMGIVIPMGADRWMSSIAQPGWQDRTVNRQLVNRGHDVERYYRIWRGQEIYRYPWNQAIRPRFQFLERSSNLLCWLLPLLLVILGGGLWRSRNGKSCHL